MIASVSKGMILNDGTNFPSRWIEIAPNDVQMVIETLATEFNKAGKDSV